MPARLPVLTSVHPRTPPSQEHPISPSAFPRSLVGPSVCPYSYHQHCRLQCSWQPSPESQREQGSCSKTTQQVGLFQCHLPLRMGWKREMAQTLILPSFLYLLENPAVEHKRVPVPVQNKPQLAGREPFPQIPQRGPAREGPGWSLPSPIPQRSPTLAPPHLSSLGP